MTLLQTFFPELYLETSNSTKYNLVKHSDSELCLELSVPGIPEENISVEVFGNKLSISVDAKDDTREYFYQGIVRRPFKTNFTLKDELVVKGAKVSNGILYVHLELQIPEEKRPRKIPLTH